MQFVPDPLITWQIRKLEANSQLVGTGLFDANNLTAWATVAAAALVAVQIGREWWRERVRRNSANARIEVIAYRLRRQIRSWIGMPAIGAVNLDTEEDFERWIRDSNNGRSLGQQLDRAEALIDELMVLRPDANRGRGESLDRVNLLFLEGARRLNEYAATARPAGAIQIMEWVQLREDSEKDFRDCLHELEQHVILPRTLGAEQALGERRLAENPVHLFAKLARDSEADADKASDPSDNTGSNPVRSVPEAVDARAPSRRSAMVDLAILKRVADSNGVLKPGASEDGLVAFEELTQALEFHAGEGLVEILSTVPNRQNSQSRYLAIRCRLTASGQERLMRGR